MPKVSIIIPVYNVEKYICRCLDSIKDQSLEDYEVIMIDDGSPDGSPAICDEYARQDSRFKVIHKQNGGVSSARNTGIEAASGEWAYFVDSDDWLVEGQLGSAVDCADDLQTDILFVDCMEQYETKGERRIRLFSEDFVFDDQERILKVQEAVLCHKRSPFFSPGADNAYPAPWSKLIRMSLIRDNNIRFDPYVGGVYDDGLFTLEIMEKAQKIAYTGICVYNYRILNSSIVHAFRKGMVEKFEKNCERVKDFADRNHKQGSFLYAEYARRVAYLSSFMSGYFFNPDNKLSANERKAELKQCLGRSPWKEAIQNARYSDLENKHKYTLMCMKTHCLLGLKTYSDLKRRYKS